MTKQSWNFSPFTYRMFILFALPVAIAAMAILSGSAQASKRVALVIGNSAYQNASPLKNPKNDATDISEKLTKLGFKVIGGFDLKKDAMMRKIRDFGRALEDADVSLFYYAGHAMQVHGRNYLAPVNTDISFEADLDFETVPMDIIQKQMERRTETALIFLDACRNNPLTRSLYKGTRSKGPQGLAKLSTTAKGTLIVFSTSPDEVALDGKGRNSPFTKAILDNIERPNLSLSNMMTDVRQQVVAATNEAQTPWATSSLLGRFYFIGGEQPATQTAALQPTQPVVAPQNNQQQLTRSTSNQDQLNEMTMQKMAWEAIQNSNNKSMYEAYINKYEGSFFADLAKAKLAELAAPKPKETKVANLDKSSQTGITPVTPAAPAVTPAAPTVNDGRSIQSAQPALRLEDVTFRIQSSLQSFGCSPGRPDGKWGRNSNRALDSFARYSNLPIISYTPSIALMEQLEKFAASGRNTGRICPAPVVKKRVVQRRTNRRVQRRNNNNNNNGAAVQNFLGGVVGGLIACKLGGC